MEIFSRCSNRSMAQGSLDQVDGASPVKGMACMGMAKPMGRNRALYPGPFCSSPHDAPRLGGMQVALSLAADEHRCIGFRLPPEPN